MSSSGAPESCDVPALVLAAGRSTRIAAVAEGRPKPLLDVAGRSLLEWNLRWLGSHGVGRVWINLYHEGDAIRAAIGSGVRLGLDVRYSDERPALLGTAGAWRRVRGEWRSTWLIVYGDNLMRFDLERLLCAHRETRARLTIALFDPARHVHTASGGGVARVEDGRVTAFHEDAQRGERGLAGRSGSLPQRGRAGVGAACATRKRIVNKRIVNRVTRARAGGSGGGRARRRSCLPRSR